MANTTGNQGQNYYDIENRFFYGLRRNDNGEVFLSKVDQTKKGESVQIATGNISGTSFTDFEVGQNFFEGRDIFHELVFDDLKYEQFKWDNRDIFFYVDDDGYFSIKINEKHIYDDNASPDGE